MNIGQILYKIGEFEVEYAPRLSGIVAKATIVGGAFLTGAGIGSEEPSLLIAGLLALPIGLSAYGVRKSVKEIRRKNRLEEAVSRAAWN